MAASTNAATVCGFVCVNCGAPANTLYRTFQGGLIELAKCPVCRGTVDRYIEFDRTLVFLDLMLLKKSAFRHVFHNESIQVDHRLLLLYLLSETYIKWTSLHYSKIQEVRDEFRWNAVLEVQFYWLFLLSCLELGVNFFMFYGLVRLQRRSCPVLSYWRPYEVFVLANYGKLFKICSAVWAHEDKLISLFLSDLFVLSSLVQAMRVIISASMFDSLTACAVPLIASKLMAFTIQLSTTS